MIGLTTTLLRLFTRQSPLPTPSLTTRLISTSPVRIARKPSKRSRKKSKIVCLPNYQRVKILKQNMFTPPPPPLRMARLRHLRHWTIHRAWQLFRRKQNEAIEKERQRMHAGMYNACEELRKTVGPGRRGEGYLYRVAMEKKEVYGLNDIPIEYARLQTETPAREAWNHGWKK